MESWVDHCLILDNSWALTNMYMYNPYTFCMWLSQVKTCSWDVVVVSCLSYLFFVYCFDMNYAVSFPYWIVSYFIRSGPFLFDYMEWVSLLKAVWLLPANIHFLFAIIPHIFISILLVYFWMIWPYTYCTLEYGVVFSILMILLSFWLKCSFRWLIQYINLSMYNVRKKYIV